jgi:hypothetical protein
MAQITNKELLDAINNMGVHVALIEKTIEPLPEMFKDMYIGNSHPPMRKTCRDYEEEKKARETAKTVTANNRLDFSNKVKLQIIGGIVTLVTVQTGLVLAAINWIPKLLGN